jgi:hypothetical protein
VLLSVVSFFLWYDYYFSSPDLSYSGYDGY